MSSPGRQWTQEEIDEDMGLDESCGQCGDQGYTYDCIDGCCLNAEEGCELCEMRCDFCNPRGDRPYTPYY